MKHKEVPFRSFFPKCNADLCVSPHHSCCFLSLKPWYWHCQENVKVVQKAVMRPNSECSVNLSRGIYICKINKKDENNLELGFRLFPFREEAIDYQFCTMLRTSLHNNSRWFLSTDSVPSTMLSTLLALLSFEPHNVSTDETVIRPIL